MKALKNNFDIVIFVLLITGYLFLATQCLATSPIYETDESYTLQVSFEMLNRGNLALPMYRYLVGNIENVWHSFTPLYFVLLSGFLKLFGIGVFQGRIFNLITFVLTLLLVYLLGCRIFNWRVGLFAIILIMSDQTVHERSRLLRNDYAAEALALLAFYLFEKAESDNRSRFYVAAGLAAGAGVMCHTSILYMICAIGLLILFKDGWRIFKSKKLYQFNWSNSKELSAKGDNLMMKPANSSANDLIELCSVDVQQGFIYQVTLETELSGEWVIIYTDEKTGAWIEQSELEEQGERQPITNYFRTVGVNRIKIAFRSIGNIKDNFMRLSRLKVREVISIDESEQADY